MGNQVEKKFLKTKKQSKNIKNHKSIQKKAELGFCDNLKYLLKDFFKCELVL
jgi:hypothetical protein